MNREEQEFFAHLSDMLRSYIDDAPTSNHRSYRQLSKKAKVSAASVTRYAQNELKNKPEAGNVFSLLKVLTGNVEESAKKMKYAYPDWWDSMGQYLKSTEELSYEEDDIELTRDHTSVLFKSYAEQGVSKAWIYNRFGSKGEELIQELMDAAYLHFDQDLQCFRATNKKDTSLNRILSQNVALASNLKHDIESEVDFDQRSAGSFYYWINVDKQGFQDFAKLYDAFWSGVNELEEKYKKVKSKKPITIKVGATRDAAINVTVEGGSK